MRRSWAGDPCCVPNCYRRSKKEVPFCERCWTVATDEERIGVQCAVHAPLYRGVIYLDVADFDTVLPANTRRVDPIPEGLWTIADDGQGRAAARYGDQWLGEALAELEARTTREAVALAIAARRRLSSDITHPEEAA